MPAMDPGQALATGEQALRQLLQAVLPTALGSDWLDQIAKPGKLTRWRRRRDDEVAKRQTKGAVVVPQDELSYVDFSELLDIVAEHWVHLSGALGSQEDTGALLRRMESLRNAVGHSRELLPFEADLLSGIAGELRNRVTVYMSTQDPSGEYYPRIESITDQYGINVTGYSVEDMPGATRTGLTLPFGTGVKFQCRATDPQGREIYWMAYMGNDAASTQATGDDVELDWTFDRPNMVGDDVRIIFRITSSSQYHRYGTYDDGAALVYRVTPPTTT